MRKFRFVSARKALARAAALSIFGCTISLGSIQGGFESTRPRRVGDTVTYRQTATLFASLLPVHLETTIEESVTAVEADGSYTVRATQKKMSVQWAYEVLMTPDEATVETYRCNARGEVIEAKVDTMNEGWPTRVRDLSQVVSPEHPVAVGGSWSFDFPANPTTGAVAAHADYKLLEEVKQEGTDALRIQVEVKETEGSSPAKSSGIVWVRKSDGVPLKYELKVTDAAIPGLPGLATGQFSRQSLP